MNLASLTDVEIVEQFKQTQDPWLIEELYRRYSQRVYWWSLKFLQSPAEAEEMVQEIFMALIADALNNYQPREDAKFSSWLYRCVGNQCLKSLRGRYEALNKQVIIEDIPQELIAKIDLDGSLLLAQRTELLTKTLNELSAMQRMCCLKFYWDGMKYEEIAKELDITYDQVRSHLQNALRNLKIAFKEPQSKKH
ncbi:MAG: sigma-70 family RNA polymerase sigma factor [Acidobacteria bacterium]|nr:sigma-70 family RNA polymerase sigma factor [Acidobacteriota bacterium]